MELSATMEMFYIGHVSMVVIVTWLLSAWNVASVIEEWDF